MAGLDGYKFAARDLPEHADLHAICRRLAAGGVLDRDFDRIYPKEILKLSRIHWTPVAVAQRAAKLLAERPGARILDVGAGAGKLCLIGAAVTPGHFTGVEQHGDLVRLSQELARRYRIANARFVHGDAFAFDWSSFDGFYFYNPFSETAEAEYVALVGRVLSRLSAARSGTRVAVYYGYGGDRPAAYRVESSESFGAGTLELWVKG